MTQDIIYTLGIIIAILLLLIFLRSVLLRRQRLAATQATTFPPAATVWQFRSDRAMDVVRPEPAVTNISLAGPPRPQTPDEQLPLYEAPPPVYDMVPKDLEQGVGPSGPPGYERGEVGEGSRGEGSRGEGSRGEGLRGEGSTGEGSRVGAGAGDRGLFRVDVRRAWGGFGR